MLLCFIVCILVLEKFFTLSCWHIFCHFCKSSKPPEISFLSNCSNQKLKSGDGTGNKVSESLDAFFTNIYVHNLILC